MKAFVAALLMSAASARYSILRDEEVLASIAHIQDTIRSGDRFSKKIMLFGQLATHFAGPKGQALRAGFDFDFGSDGLGLGLTGQALALENEWKNELRSSGDGADYDPHHGNYYENHGDQFDGHIRTHWNWFIQQANRAEPKLDDDAGIWQVLFEEYDSNDDGHLDSAEYAKMQIAINRYKTEYYYGDEEKFWPLKSKYCDANVNQEQSPIDFDSSAVDRNVGSGAKAEFFAFTSVFNVSYTNNRISMMSVDEAGDQDFKSVWFAHSEGDGGARLEFTFDHVDLRFGSNNSEGSEHRIDGKQWPLEMQWVYYGQDFASLDEAVLTGKNLYESDDPNADDQHTVLIVSVLFEIHEHEFNNSYVNPSLNKILNGYRNDSVDERIELDLTDLLPNNMTLVAPGETQSTSNFYRYQGSLTTPECYPIVNWFVLKDTVLVGEKTMNRLHELTDNARVFRDTQDNTNTVYELDQDNSIGFEIFMDG